MFLEYRCVLRKLRMIGVYNICRKIKALGLSFCKICKEEFILKKVVFKYGRNKPVKKPEIEERCKPNPLYVKEPK